MDLVWRCTCSDMYIYIYTAMYYFILYHIILCHIIYMLVRKELTKYVYIYNLKD